MWRAVAALAVAAVGAAGACSDEQSAELGGRAGEAVGRASTAAFCAAIRNNADDTARDLARALVTVAPAEVRDDLRAYAERGDEAARERVRTAVRERCGEEAARRI